MGFIIIELEEAEDKKKKGYSLKGFPAGTIGGPIIFSLYLCKVFKILFSGYGPVY